MGLNGKWKWVKLSRTEAAVCDLSTQSNTTAISVVSGHIHRVLRHSNMGKVLVRMMILPDDHV